LIRAVTREVHDAAEHSPFQKRFARARMERREYVSFLWQMRWAHEALEGAILRAMACESRLARLIRPYHFRLILVQSDLAWLGELDESEPAGEAVTRLGAVLDEQARDGAIGLVGCHYVLEGSTNGSKYIARNVARALGLSRGMGLLYLDPHGDAQTERWAAYRRGMDALELSEREQQRVIAAAMATFQCVMDVGAELDARPAAADGAIGASAVAQAAATLAADVGGKPRGGCPFAH
jgi:heme oxygenase